jgi:hypothetical protein
LASARGAGKRRKRRIVGGKGSKRASFKFSSKRRDNGSVVTGLMENINLSLP